MLTRIYEAAQTAAYHSLGRMRVRRCVHRIEAWRGRKYIGFGTAERWGVPLAPLFLRILLD